MENSREQITVRSMVKRPSNDYQNIYIYILVETKDGSETESSKACDFLVYSEQI